MTTTQHGTPVRIIRKVKPWKSTGQTLDQYEVEYLGGKREGQRDLILGIYIKGVEEWEKRNGLVQT